MPGNLSHLFLFLNEVCGNFSYIMRALLGIEKYPRFELKLTTAFIAF